ncbi:hypothetical protein A2361_01570 [Candidatus Woesebacteria bacterium RIFOXYB1_FULL_40_26]|uniref:PEGA domain-containing protein n=1 Tax=Candidatus Woesebacteria bacterium RIFOXYB1_FULL_40_26 TaxID=1802539 RepID=A0A1F8CYD4_9BACT|nr:MAG: hypothetical protein A2361_01570 [Candidatus Woesebacteria bacterium RIFOXYB1_FULL_40_26]
MAHYIDNFQPQQGGECYTLLVTKIRLLVITLTILIVGSLGYLATLYARGFRFDTKTFKFTPNGILVIKSDPSGAQIFINGELKTASDASISVSPGTYDVTLKKEGFISWNKRLTIEKEVVTEADVSLFRTVASLSPITFSGCVNPKVSFDYARIACFIPQNDIGLWVIETFNLPLGFVREPRRVTDGDLTDTIWDFSPNDRQILLTTKQGMFLLDTGTFTPQAQRVNVASRKNTILAEWEEEKQIKLTAQLRNLSPEVADILNRKASSVAFSFDETKVLYTASGSATLRDNLIPSLPGSSTQKQERDIKEGNTYIYDIKEDRNFLVYEGEINPATTALRWFPTSQNLILAEDGKITIMDYDGTNRQVIYSGSYIAPNAYPSSSPGKLLILTNLGATDASFPNLYSLSLK